MHPAIRGSRAICFLLLVSAVGRNLCGQNIGSLKSVSVPKPPNLAKYVRDQNALLVLGKALFWDMQLGSDGKTACASCHFHAGADHRIQNQLSNPVGTFLPNAVLTMGDFPFHALSDVNDNRSPLMHDSAQRVGSSGLFRRLFSDVTPGGTADIGLDLSDLPAFSISGLNVRQVTPRNTPTVINSVFNFRNFWDGRASNIFTGRTPFGDSDTRANALLLSNGQLVPEAVRIENSSLASQSVGPAISNVEMSYDGRTWPQLGKKILALRPLALQTVAPDDSVLGSFAASASRGMAAQYTYLGLIQAAFQPEYWSGQQLSNDSTQAEYNFSLFFGLAVQAYEATLVSDDSRFDRFSEGDTSALTSVEQAGMQIFRGRSQCTTCHVGAEFTEASFGSVSRRGPVDRARNGAGTDTGFFRTGVRPIADDIGLGGLDDFGKPFSVAAGSSVRPAVNGTFKTPGLRNVEFTGPYFHNGGQATLEQVVAFYSRGGDFTADGNIGPDIRRLNLSADDRAALVAFLKALSDDRVRFERAPFDHPELCVPIGQLEASPGVLQADAVFPLSAADKWAALPAVGRQGNPVPLQTFEELLGGVGADGSRAHTMTDACSIQ